MSEIFWVSELDGAVPDVAYFTRQPDGLSGMTPAALAQFVVTPVSAVEKVLERIKSNDDLPSPLQRYGGQSYNLAASDSYQGSYSEIIPDFLCQAIIEAFTTAKKDYPGKQEALKNKQTLMSGAVRVFIWGKTNYQFRVAGSYWNKRIAIALSSKSRPVPKGYFSIYSEMMDLFRELEIRFNYIIPDINPEKDEYLIPDISIGQLFNSFLRSEADKDRKIRQEYLGSDDVIDFRESGKDNSEIEYYFHIYPTESHGGSSKQRSNAYPIKYSSIFKYYFFNHWIPERFPAYLKDRDRQGYQYLETRIKALSSGDASVLRSTILGDIIDLFLPKLEGDY